MMISKPKPEYLQAVGLSVVTWSDLNLQSAVYVYRAEHQEIDIDEILEIAVMHEQPFRKRMKEAGMEGDLVEKRQALAARRNALAHSIISNNTKGAKRLWRPEHNDVPAHPLNISDIEEFISEVNALKTSVMSAEVSRFGAIR